MTTCGRDFIRKGKGKIAEEFAFSRGANIWEFGKYPFDCHARACCAIEFYDFYHDIW